MRRGAQGLANIAAARDFWRRGADRGVVPGGAAGESFPWEGCV